MGHQSAPSTAASPPRASRSRSGASTISAGTGTSLALVLALVLAATPGSARAHGNLLESTRPADGATVASPIDEVVATYSSRPSVGDVSVIAPDGSRTTRRARVRGDRFIVPLEPDQAGAWRLEWSIRQQDGHAVEYDLSFDVADSAAPVDPLDDAIRAAVDAALSATRAIFAGW